MHTLSFAALELGQRFPEIRHDVTQEVVDRAALAHLDFNPVHTNIEWSERAQVFGTPKTVGHGMLTMSLMVSVIHRHWRDQGAVVTGVEAKLTKPVPVGQSIRCVGEVKELHPRGAGEDFVVVDVTAYDGNDDVVGVGSVSVRVPA